MLKGVVKNMKITHVEHKSSKIKITADKHEHERSKPEFGLADLPKLSRIVKSFYHPTIFNSSNIVFSISSIYSNLVAVPVKAIIHSGVIQRKAHFVCKVEGTPLLIDPAGDCIEYSDLGLLKSDIVPWIYMRSSDRSLYLSQSHMPFTVPKVTGADPFGLIDNLTEGNLIEISRDEKDFRCIIV